MGLLATPWQAQKKGEAPMFSDDIMSIRHVFGTHFMYDMATALRGPDDGRLRVLKTIFTAPLRYLIVDTAQLGSDRIFGCHRCCPLRDVLEFDRVRSGLESIRWAIFQDAISQDTGLWQSATHFLVHFNNAADALRPRLHSYPRQQNNVRLLANLAFSLYSGRSADLTDHFTQALQDLWDNEVSYILRKEQK